MPRPAPPAVAGVERSAKQILLDYVTRFMYEEISYIIVFESRCGLPRRALFSRAETKGCHGAVLHQALYRPDESWGEMLAYARDFAGSIYARKFPCKFPVVYRGAPICSSLGCTCKRTRARAAIGPV